MAKALSFDLRRRVRVVGAIEHGLSCRQAAERFGVSASSAIRWLDRLKKQGDVAANGSAATASRAASKPKRTFSLARSQGRRTSRLSSSRRS